MPKINPLLRSIHWINVFLLIALYTSAYYRDLYTTQLESSNWYFLLIHMNLGVTIFILTIISVVIRFKGSRNTVATLKRTDIVSQGVMVATPLQDKLTSIMHWALYILLLLMPIAAYIGIGFDIPLFGGVITISNPARFEFIHEFSNSIFGMSFISATQPLFYFHVDWGAEILMPFLLIGHVSAALYHQFIIGDNTLANMWFSRS